MRVRDPLARRSSLRIFVAMAWDSGATVGIARNNKAHDVFEGRSATRN